MKELDVILMLKKLITLFFCFYCNKKGSCNIKSKDIVRMHKLIICKNMVLLRNIEVEKLELKHILLM